MKIKILILDLDKNYISRITTVFTNKYMDKLEVYSFTDAKKAMEEIHTIRPDVFLASENFELNVDDIPSKCGFAYLVNSNGIEEIYEQKAICKYQKVELIYKQILEIFADVSSNITGAKFDNKNTNIVAFYGCSGGTGSSSLATAYAKNMSQKGLKVLFINCEKYGSTDYFFSGTGNQTFSDVLYAVKSKKTNLSIKLESAVRIDDSGVNFYEASSMAMDTAEMKKEDFQTLINVLKTAFDYDVIVLDADLSLEEIFGEINHLANIIVISSDGSEISNKKLFRLCEYLKIVEQQTDERILAKAKLIYNKFSNKTGKVLENLDITLVGGVPRFEHATIKQVVEQLQSRSEMLEKINS